MGFYFRKSKSFGPIRVNLSKSGIGLSAGVKGARVSVGPRGTYINAGRNGIYYRKKIGGKKTQSANNSPNNSVNGFDGSPQPRNDGAAYDYSNSVQVDDTGSVLSREIIRKIWIERVSFWVWLVVSIILILSLKTGGVVFAICSGVALLCFLRAKVEYELDEASANEWNAFLEGILYIRNSSKIWIIENQLYNTNRKVNAGSSLSVSRSYASVFRHEANTATGLKIRTNIQTVSIRSSQVKLLFLPNGIVIERGMKIYAYPYDLISVIASSINFVESEQVSRDAEVINYTWQYVNKNGTPDRRYSNNRQLPVCRYGLIQIHGVNLNIELETSNPYVTANVGNVYERYRRFIDEPVAEPVDEINTPYREPEYFHTEADTQENYRGNTPPERNLDPTDEVHEKSNEDSSIMSEENSRKEWIDRVNRRKRAIANEKPKVDVADERDSQISRDSNNPIDDLFDFYDEV